MLSDILTVLRHKTQRGRRDGIKKKGGERGEMKQEKHSLGSGIVEGDGLVELSVQIMSALHCSCPSYSGKQQQNN